MSKSNDEELTATVFSALHALTQQHKANFLLETALEMINNGRYGPDVENYLEVYLRTPGLPKNQMARALLARGHARQACGESLLAKAQEDFQAVLKLDPGNRESQLNLRRKQITFADEPPSRRAPPEIWERIAMHIPRYHLRTWFFISEFHRDIAARLIFHTIDLYFGDDPENINRGLDIFDRAKADPVFASRVKCLRIHWAIEEGEMMDLMCRIFRTSLPEFKDLRDFEWIGYPELQPEAVQYILSSHPNLHNLGIIGWHFDASGVSAFKNLRKFTLRAEDDDGNADMNEIRTVLDENSTTLRHLILGAFLERSHSWDSAFQSVTIQNLTHLDVVDTKLSHFVLSRIAHTSELRSLTLHGTLEDAHSAAVIFGSDHIVDGKHTFLPHLHSFRFVVIGHDDDMALYQAVVKFLKNRTQLRRLDLGHCPWELVHGLLPGLTGLRVLGVRIAHLSQASVRALVTLLPEVMAAIHLSTVVSDKPLTEYAYLFSRFPSLSFLHLLSNTPRRRSPPSHLPSNQPSEKDCARTIANAVPSLDFVGWCGEHSVVIRANDEKLVELKELPVQKRLDCCKGVDLGTDDAEWLERKDVPIDYELTGADS